MLVDDEVLNVELLKKRRLIIIKWASHPQFYSRDVARRRRRRRINFYVSERDSP